MNVLKFLYNNIETHVEFKNISITIIKSLSSFSSCYINLIFEFKHLLSKLFIKSILEPEFQVKTIEKTMKIFFYKLRCDVILILCNLTANSNIAQIKELMDGGILEIFLHFLAEKNFIYLEKLISSCEIILKWGDHLKREENQIENIYKKNFEELNGVQTLMCLLSKNVTINVSQQLSRILNDYF